MLRLLLCLFAVLSAAAHAGPKIEQWTTANGAKVLFIESRALPILDIQVDFPAGSARNPAEKAGLASLVAELLLAGAGPWDEEAFSARLVELGVRLSSTHDHDKASITLRTLSTPREKEGALDALTAVLAAPIFPEAAFEREKSRLIAALKEADTRPDQLAAKAFARALYPEHPYGRIATPDTVARITREDVIAHHQRHYVASGAVISMIGDISRQEAETIAQRLAQAMRQGPPPEALPPVAPPPAETVRVEHPATQAHIHLGLPALARKDPDFYALLVGNYTLGGGGFVSRLMKEVREKRGYAYSVYSYFAPRLRPGPFEIGLQTQRNQAKEALEVARAVLERFLAEGPTQGELAAAKKNLINGQALRIDSNAKLLGYLSLIGFYDLPLSYLDDFPKKIAAVTREDVKSAFARHIKPERLITVIVAGE
ncbi:MAG: insulinase family protein [Rhodocyclaceae bacterium]|nr:insulinase family protein [Rhodocyclaceae bacterium]